MTAKRVFLSAPTQNQTEKFHIKKVLESNWLAPSGPYNQKFTQNLANLLKSNILLTNSGTSALQLALQQIGVEKGDHVLCSTFTFAASAFPIEYLGAKPVFVDIELDTWNLSPQYLESAIIDLHKNGIQPKALVLVHSYGVSAKINEIKHICAQYNIPWIEDAAETLGSTFKNQALGTFGQAGILSFNGNKIITTTAGGALISHNQLLIKEAQKLANQAKEHVPEYNEHHKIGYNFAMSNLCAAIGYAQLQDLNARIEGRRNIFDFYSRILAKKFGEIQYPKEIKDSFSNRWLSVFNLPNNQKDLLYQRLEKNNIESRFLWKPMHCQSVFKHALYYGNRESESLFQNGIALPSGNGLSNEDLQRIEKLVHEL